MTDPSRESKATAKTAFSTVAAGFDAIEPEASIVIDGIDDGVLSELFDRIHIDVGLRDGDRTRVVPHVPVHIGHTMFGADDMPARESGEAIKSIKSTESIGGNDGFGGNESKADEVNDGKNNGGKNNDNEATGDAGSSAPPSGHDDGAIVVRRAVIALTSRVPDGEGLFRIAVVTLDSTPGNEITGISPLYHVAGLDGPDRLSAVLELSTRLEPDTLAGMLASIEISHEGAVHLRLVDMEGEACETQTCTIPWPPARTSAAVLAPWFDMDPQAAYDGTPVSFLLAMAPDAGQVGMASDHWIIGETQ